MARKRFTAYGGMAHNMLTTQKSVARLVAKANK